MDVGTPNWVHVATPPTAPSCVLPLRLPLTHPPCCTRHTELVPLPSSLNLCPCTYPLLPLPTHPRYLSTDQSCRYAIKSARMLVPGNDWRGISATYQVRLL